MGSQCAGFVIARGATEIPQHGPVVWLVNSLREKNRKPKSGVHCKGSVEYKAVRSYILKVSGGDVGMGRYVDDDRVFGDSLP